MKFYAPTDEPVHIALTSGHTAVVERSGTELPSIFHREAVARGALLPSQLDLGALPTPVVDALTGQDVTAQRGAAVRAAITAMMDGSDDGDFNGDGRPNLARLKARVGFDITREEADAAFEDVNG